MNLRYTLVTDGSSDRTLLSALDWLLLEKLPNSITLESSWADLRSLPSPPRALTEKIKTAAELYPCDLLFIHRDAESVEFSVRRSEISQAVSEANYLTSDYVAIVPVRMQEAWLLLDESAIRLAAGNPNGTMELDLPTVTNLEQIVEPKDLLHSLLKQASGLGSRRRQKLNVSERVHRVSELIEDFSPLRALSAFQELEREIDQVLANILRQPGDTEGPEKRP